MLQIIARLTGFPFAYAPAREVLEIISAYADHVLSTIEGVVVIPSMVILGLCLYFFGCLFT
jgi:hypothetical protein